jgi:hypothetical protein
VSATHITARYDSQSAHIQQLVAAQVTTGADPFDHMADFKPPTEADRQRARIAHLETLIEQARAFLNPVKKATKPVLEGQIENARNVLARG